MDDSYWELEIDLATFRADGYADKILAFNYRQMWFECLQYRPAWTESSSAGTVIWQTMVSREPAFMPFHSSFDLLLLATILLLDTHFETTLPGVRWSTA